MTWTCTVSVSFSPKKSKSCQIHVTFMAVSLQFHGTFTYKPYLGTVCQNLLKKLSKKSVLVVDVFFCLISASFLAICQIHVGFMALSWHFHGGFFLLIFECFSKQFHGSCMSDSWQIHRGFIADSCQFLSIPKNQNHVRFMSLSWQFHGGFMALSHTSLTWVPSAKIYWKKLSKKSVFVVDVFFCLISASFLAICQIHVGFMALSWHFHGGFFLLIFECFPNSFMAVAWQIHGRFMGLSWRFHVTFLALFPLGMFGFAMKMPWKCHESAKPRWNLHVRFMSICVCLFLSICRQCFFWCYFHWWFLRFRLINFFWGFLWSKYRVIRNTQTTNPNPQLVFSWWPSRRGDLPTFVSLVQDWQIFSFYSFSLDLAAWEISTNLTGL